jgi:hypothetical protein
MDKRHAERCPFSGPFNKGRKAVNKGKRLYFLWNTAFLPLCPDLVPRNWLVSVTQCFRQKDSLNLPSFNGYFFNISLAGVYSVFYFKALNNPSNGCAPIVPMNIHVHTFLNSSCFTPFHLLTPDTIICLPYTSVPCVRSNVVALQYLRLSGNAGYGYVLFDSVKKFL